jgi:hypothetical protein
MTITEALNSLSLGLASRGFDIIDLGCDDDEDIIIYALNYLENHLNDVLEDQIEVREAILDNAENGFGTNTNWNSRSKPIVTGLCEHGIPLDVDCKLCFPF